MPVRRRPPDQGANTERSGPNRGRRLRKGATDAIVQFVTGQGGKIPANFTEMSDRISRTGGTPLAVADGDRLLGIVHLKDIVKGGMRERLEQLRVMGIRSVMITGDNPLTAAAIANEAGVDDFLAQATPKDKMDYIKKEQAQGRLVAMTGDGTNDAPALAQADVGVAMNTGTMAAKEAGNMVDLDSNPTKLIEIVAIGKQLLITRGALNHLFNSERCVQVLRHHPGDVCGHLSGARQAQHHAPAQSAERRSGGGDLQCADHYRARPPGLARGEIQTAKRRRHVEPQPLDLRIRRVHCALPMYLADRPAARSVALGVGPSGARPYKEFCMRYQLSQAFRFTLLMTVLTGLIYPGVVTGLCQLLFPRPANGSLLEVNGEIKGSTLLGQNFSKPEYFHPRPSAAGNDGYDATASGGSNLGPTNQKLIDRVKADIAKFRQENPAYQGPIPADMLTTSASGLDPDISPASALAQAPRVAQARGATLDQVRQLIEAHTEGRQLGFLANRASMSSPESRAGQAVTSSLIQSRNHGARGQR